MDTPKLSEDLIRAGQKYYDALGRLGFYPEGLFWAHDVKAEETRLWLVWSGLDKYGPLAIYKLLFKAYKGAILPSEIDPFIVNVVGSQHMVGKLSNSMKTRLPNDDDAVMWRIVRDNEDVLYEVSRSWIYHLQDKSYNVRKIDKDWRVFSKRVQALAA